MKKIAETDIGLRKPQKNKRLIMIFLLLFSIVQGTAFGQSVLEQKVTVKADDKTLEQIIKQISSITQVEFIYVSNVFDNKEKLSVDYKNKPLSEILNELLTIKNIEFVEEYSRIILRKIEKDLTPPGKSGTVPAPQKKVVSGKIIDAKDSEPIIGVTIVEKGSTNGTVTNIDGVYTLTLSNPEAVLQYRYIGYKVQEITAAGKNQIDVVMEVDASEIDEVMVVGYGTKKKSDVIGSVVSVKGDDLQMKSSASFESSLQGIAAGVSVQTQGGSPGAPAIIKIRGVNSINATTDPLWVIDGMILDRNPYGVGSSNQSPMSLINQNDIESIEVLKDAAATAIYGSRASSGVILVTTKRGQAGKAQTTVSYDYGVSEITQTPQDLGYANTKQWMAIQDVAFQNTVGRDFKTLDYYLRSPNADVKLSREEAESYDTNWTDEVFRMGSFHDLNVSSSKGFEGGSFYISGNYRNEEGVQKYNDFKRYTVTASLNLEPFKNFKFGLKANLAKTDNERRSSGTTSIITYALPWFPVKDPTNLNRYYNPYTGTNPTAQNDPKNVLNNVIQYRALIGAFAEYKIPKVEGLSVRTELSTDFIQSNIVNWTSRNIQYIGDQVPTSSAMEEAVTHNSYIFNIYPTYTSTFGLHNLNVVAGYEMQSSGNYYRSMSGVDLNGNYQELGSPNIMTGMYGGYGGERYLMAYFGRADYKFNDKYLFGFSARRDGSSSFTPENRWGNFLAFSAGWKLSEESFMDFLGDENFIKLRGSYGETGNQDIPSSLSSPQYNGNIFYGGTSIGGVNGTLRENIPNENLRWETTKSADGGIDFGFLKNRINGSFAYYHRYVENLLLWVPLPWSTGIASQNPDFGQASYDETSNQIMDNIGDMLNSGTELDLHTVNISKPNFTWKTEFNISFNNTTIKKLAPYIDNNGKGLAHEGMPTRSRTGYKRAVWFIADWAGVDPQTGVPMIYTLDKDVYEATGDTKRLLDENGNPVLSYATTTNIGENPFYQEGKSIDPTYYGGLKNTFTYKSFDFNFLFSFSGGNYIMDYDRQISTVPNVTRNILSEVMDQSWKAPGDITKYPQIRAKGEYIVDGATLRGFDNSNVYHNRELYKGDYIRLRNVQLGYNFNASILDRIKIKSLRIYAQGSNLFTITNYPGFDPEGATFVYYSSQIPQTRSFTFGINAQF